MPPKKAGKASAAKKVWVGFDNQGIDNSGKKLSSLQDWWKSFESQATAEASAPPPSAEGNDSTLEKSATKGTKTDEKGAVIVEKWYGVSQHYWEGMEASDSGMLAGFESTSPVDIEASRKLIQQLFDGLKDFNLKVLPNRCIDVGAGIGRISKLLLAPMFRTVDILEQNQSFVDKAKQDLTAPSSGVSERMGQFFCSPLQTFEFPADVKYDVIWIQWVLLYLLDVDLITFLKRCKAALNPHGVLIVKENVSRDGYYVDNEDNSITRSTTHFKSVFASAGLKLVRDEVQPNWPAELFPVRMYVLL